MWKMDCCWYGRQEESLRYDHKEFSGLHLASKTGNVDEAESLINDERDLHAILSNNEAGCTPLHVAVTYNKTNIIKILLKKGSDFTLKDDVGETPLHIAFKQYSQKSIQLILQAYYTACSRINGGINRALAERNFPTDSDINVHSRFLENFRPLHFAVTFALVDIIPILIGNGVDIGATDSNGMTALHYAVQHSQTGLLIEDYLHTMFTGIHCTHRNTIFLLNLITIIDMLLHSGCDINAIDNFGKTPIFYLVDRLSNRTNKYTKVEVDENFRMLSFLARAVIIEKLLMHNPDLLVKDDEGNTILHAVAKTADDHYMIYELSIAFRYLQVGGNVNELNDAGHTALYYACESGYKALAKLLLSNGADVNLTRSENRDRPIHAAVRYLTQDPRLSIENQINLIQLLLQCGAYVDAEMADGTTPILLATSPKCYAINIPLMMCLFNWGCDVNCADAKGRTPLHNICQMKRLRLIEEFLWHGADVDAVDAQGNTPFSIAFRWRSFDLINSLNVHSWLRRLTVLGAPLSQANRELYALLEGKNGNMLEVGRGILPRRMLEQERIVNWREYVEKAKEMPSEEQCREELKRMKTVFVDVNLTLYDILLSNTKHYTRNANILANTCLDDYPVYGYLVKAKLRITRKGVLLNRATQFIKKIFQADMPDVCNSIISHLQHEDLVNFTQAIVLDTNEDEIEETEDAERLRLS